MHISLLIATIGRTTELSRLLESICQQSHKRVEVLICDQNPVGYLDNTLAPYRQRLQLQVISSPPVGVSAARNALLPHTKGDILSFPDDDCWYAPDTLEKVVTFFMKYNHVGSLMGIWGDNAENLIAKNKDFSQSQISEQNLFIRGETYVQFYRRHIINAIGGFDETLGPGTGLPYGCGEDTNYILRAANIAPVWRVPSVHIYHPLPSVRTPNKEKLYAYACGRMYLLRKHNFSLWFKLANIFFPLYRLLCEGPASKQYRWYMFLGRMKGFFSK